MGSDWWMAGYFEQPVVLVSWIVWIIGSITLHELGHGVAAIRQGDRTPIETGHMTLNPIVHMGVPSLILFVITGIAWGAMPVNPSRFRSRYGDVFVSFAGPFVNLCLAALCIVATGFLVAYPSALGDPLHENLTTFFGLGATLNIVLFAFNLLPIPPLDGSRIVAAFAPSFREKIESETGMVVSLIAVALLFTFGSAYIYGAGEAAAIEGVAFVKRCIGGPGTA